MNRQPAKPKPPTKTNSNQLGTASNAHTQEEDNTTEHTKQPTKQHIEHLETHKHKQGNNLQQPFDENAEQGNEGGHVHGTTDGDGGQRPTHARKARGKRWEQVRREARGQGSTRRAAIARANEVCDAEFPEFAAEYPAPPEPEPAPDPPAEPPAEDAGHVRGLGDIPADWPSLPPNASLAAEVQWVQSSRIDVVEATAGGYRIHLDRADRPVPSKAALGWLETAVLFPAKFADVAVKATQHQEDEREHARRERLAIDEVEALLAEMLEAYEGS